MSELCSIVDGEPPRDGATMPAKDVTAVAKFEIDWTGVAIDETDVASVVYGGGKNYAQVVTDGLDENLRDFKQYRVNISILAESDDDVMIDQGRFLPLAAGSQDFRFFMYSKDSANNFDKQKADAANGIKYDALYGIGR